MAQRSENLPMSGIPVFWQDPSTEIQHEWSRWIESFNIIRRIDEGRLGNSQKEKTNGRCRRPYSPKKRSGFCILLSSEKQHEKTTGREAKDGYKDHKFERSAERM